MWLARPIYELLPYLYMLAGGALLVGSWKVRIHPWPSVFLILGALALLVGLVLWLKRRDYRTTQTQYNSKSLDE